MKPNEIKIEDVLRLPPGSLEEMEPTLRRILDRLHSNVGLSADPAQEAAIFHSSAILPSRWRQIGMLSVAALLIAAVGIGFKWQSRYGTLETSGGETHWVFQGTTFGEGGGLLTLRDGSRVEIRTASEVLLERAVDGVRIRLNKGSIIVNAAKQRDGHLYVQTKDMMVAVVGTVFVVKAEKTGSRIAVVEGVVEVRQGAAEKRLRPGEHIATYPSMESHTVREEIAWSRHVEEHLTLLQQASASQSVPPPEWQTAAGGKMSFEVASVRPSGERDLGLFPLNNDDTYRQTGGRFRGSFSLINYVQFAYKLSLTAQQQETLLDQMPKWAATGYFAIQAKAPISNPTKDQMRLMLQSLLADRFKLALHFEPQQVPIFALTLVTPGKLGSQIYPHADGPPCPAKRDNSELFPKDPSSNAWPSSCGAVIAGPPGHPGPPEMKKVSAHDQIVGGRDVSMERILGSFTSLGELGRPIVDQTRLKGTFDYRLEWTPEPGSIWARLDPIGQTAEFQRTTFTEALKEQLGMRLEATKASIPVLVIDHVEMPSEN